jgi:hypothetical protein
MTTDDLASKLCDTDYLFVGAADAVFWERFGSLFTTAPTDERVFVVEPTPSGSVTLVPLSPPS